MDILLQKAIDVSLGVLHRLIGFDVSQQGFIDPMLQARADLAVLRMYGTIVDTDYLPLLQLNIRIFP